MVDTLIGRTIDKYQVAERIGHGGMSEVFKAYFVESGELVALKILHAFHAKEQNFLYRFDREAKAMAQLDHPNIVSIFDFDTTGDVPYIAMEYVGGGTLKDRFKQLRDAGELLPLDEAVQIIIEIADALGYAHDHDLIHRDIKPANILFADDGRAVLTDFGIVKIMGASTHHTATGAMIGTPAYMSPEQGLGRAGDARSDIYALGVLFFQMVTGQLPYDADKPLAVVLKHINEPIPYPLSVNPNLPESIGRVIVKALSKNPHDRFQTAQEMANAVRQVALASDEAWADNVPDHLKVLDEGADSFVYEVDDEPTVVTERAQWVSRPAPSATLVARPATQTMTLESPRRSLQGLTLLMMLIAVFSALMMTTNRDWVDQLGFAFGRIADTPISNEQPTATATREITVIGGIAAETRFPTPIIASTNAPQSPATATAVALAADLANCHYEVELLNSFTYNLATNAVPISTRFPINWVLRNNGTCDLLSGATLHHSGGESFGFDAPIELGKNLAPGEQTTITGRLYSPTQAGRYESQWQLVDLADNLVSADLSFYVLVYEPPTPTPLPPNVTVTIAEPTLQPTATESVPEPSTTLSPTPPPLSQGAVDFSFSFSQCEISGDDWRCLMEVVPTGGRGGPYTLWIWDNSPPTEYTHISSQSHWITALQCDPWLHEVRVQDETSGESRSKNVYLDPTAPPIADLLNGACSTNR